MVTLFIFCNFERKNRINKIHQISILNQNDACRLSNPIQPLAFCIFWAAIIEILQWYSFAMRWRWMSFWLNSDWANAGSPVWVTSTFQKLWRSIPHSHLWIYVANRSEPKDWVVSAMRWFGIKHSLTWTFWWQFEWALCSKRTNVSFGNTWNFMIY